MSACLDVSLIQAEFDRLAAFSQDGFTHQQTRVILSKITPLAHVQHDLDCDISLLNYYLKAKLMVVVDAISGRDTLYFAVQGSTHPWKMRSLKSQVAEQLSGSKFSRQ